MVIPSFFVPHYIISLYGVGTAVRDRMPRLVLEENQDGGRISDGSFIEGLYFYLFLFYFTLLEYGCPDGELYISTRASILRS